MNRSNWDDRSISLNLYVTKEEKSHILNAKKSVIKQENDQTVTTQEDDVINTLIYAIIKNYIGDPTLFQEKSAEILLNLTCRKLQDFRWYKDMFLTKVMLRPDCKEAYWKERFIAGLPNLFAEKIRNTLREKYANQIPYKDLTYGELISCVNKEGLSICSDLRLKAKLKKDRITSKNELGDFCQQYGYQPISTPSSSKSKHKKYSKKKFSKNKYKENKHEEKYKDKRASKKSYKKYKKPNKTNQKESKDLVICYKCGKTGHMAKNCYVKKRINELDISDQLKAQISRLILNNNSSDDESDYDLNFVQNYSSSEESESSCECIGKCTCNQINVITNEEREILELLDKIQDKEIKNQITNKLFNKQKEPIISTQSFNLQEVYSRFTKSTTPITIEDLQKESKIVKNEIKLIKDRLSIVENDKEPIEQTNEQTDDQTITQIKNKKINLTQGITTQKWNVYINLCINNEFKVTVLALIDSGADMNCIQEGIIPTKYYEKTRNRLSTASGSLLNIQYKVSNVHICNDEYCYKTSLILVKNLTSTLILGTIFIIQL